MKKVILASASPRRREMFEKAGIVFEVIPGQGEEIQKGNTMEEIVENLARNKAGEVAGRVEAQAAPGTVVIGADTLVVLGEQILGKPENEEAAVCMLKQLQGRSHRVLTGVSAMIRTDRGWDSHTFHESTDVFFYPVTEEEIREYAATGEPMDKAGGYGIQGLFGIYVQKIHGDYNNVVGLPMARLFQEMKKIGIDLRRMDK